MNTATASDKDVDQSSTDALIHSVMVAQKRTKSRDVLPELEPADNSAPKAKSKKRAGKNHTAKRSTQPAGAPLNLKARVLGYRPTRNHIVLAVLALVVVMRPWLIPGVLFVGFWVGLIAWLTVGPDRMTEWAASAWDKLCTRKPELAEKLRRKADRFALRFDAFLDKLPDSWAEKLALPDLSRVVETDEDLDERPDPFDRLKLPEVYRG